MKKILPLLVIACSAAIFSCGSQDLYTVIVQNYSSVTVSGTITTDDKTELFTVWPGQSAAIGVSAPYTVSYGNYYGRVTGRIDYSSHTVTFTKNDGIPLELTNKTGKIVHVYTGGYIEGEKPEKYNSDNFDGWYEVDTSPSPSPSSTTIFTENPSFTAQTEDKIPVRIVYIIDRTTGSKTMKGVINY